MRLKVANSGLGRKSIGIIRFHDRMIPCAVGKNGITRLKREGDGCTPAGRFRLLHVLYRPDRVMRPNIPLPVTKLNDHYGWCDDPTDPNYNRMVILPYPSSRENLWRIDHLYDYILVLDYNFSKTKRFCGSAIFVHLATADLQPTLGCVAVKLHHMLQILNQIKSDTYFDIS